MKLSLPFILLSTVATISLYSTSPLVVAMGHEGQQQESHPFHPGHHHRRGILPDLLGNMDIRAQACPSIRVRVSEDGTKNVVPQSENPNCPNYVPPTNVVASHPPSVSSVDQASAIASPSNPPVDRKKNKKCKKPSSSGGGGDDDGSSEEPTEEAVATDEDESSEEQTDEVVEEDSSDDITTDEAVATDEDEGEDESSEEPTEDSGEDNDDATTGEAVDGDESSQPTPNPMVDADNEEKPASPASGASPEPVFQSINTLSFNDEDPAKPASAAKPQPTISNEDDDESDEEPIDIMTFVDPTYKPAYYSLILNDPLDDPETKDEDAGPAGDVNKPLFPATYKPAYQSITL
ncbi:hypothetical protein H4219_005633 [Mycoemilia scoparia]|uniref:Uncharacterized protein n=1 Tax=Mycoemilia scoparia TaxID=417184 RepID=A0A9W8DJG9_9FUNG|nr:hypothetical protein H4219_005633 [Mycoemilia scoparia]